MKCDEAREMLLEADLDALEARGKSELATHLRRCDACRDAGRRVLTAQRGLDEAFSTLVDELGRGVGTAGAPAGTPEDAEARRRPGRRFPALPLLLAAAAALLLVLWPLDGSRTPTPPDVGERPPGDPGPAGPATTEPGVRSFSLDVTGERRAAVFRTSDPTITVVWLY